MAESIAILLGNTKCKSLNRLDCVRKDVAEMKKLVTATEKFSSIYVYLDRPKSEVKDELKALAKSHPHTAELFFYFSGHGVSDQDNFYMCFSDFNEVTPTVRWSNTSLPKSREPGPSFPCWTQRELGKLQLLPF